MPVVSNTSPLLNLVRKYYGYVADLEGSGGEAFDLLFVRDKIQRILEESMPEEEIPTPLFERLHELDDLLWAECIQRIAANGCYLKNRRDDSHLRCDFRFLPCLTAWVSPKEIR